MSVAIKVDDLVEDIRQLCALPTFTASTPITQAAIYRMVQETAGRLGTKLHAVMGDLDFYAQATVSYTAGVNVASLPKNFARLVNMCWVNPTNSQTVVMLPATKDDLSRIVTKDWNMERPCYLIAARAALHVFPPPQANVDINVQYTSGIFTTLTPGVDNAFDGQSSWGEWIVADVCAKVTRRAQRDPIDFLQHREEVWASIAASAPNRDANAVHDVQQNQYAHDLTRYDSMPWP